MIPARRKIRLKEGNAKCRHQKIYLERDFAAAIYLPEAPPLQGLGAWSSNFVGSQSGQIRSVKLHQSWVANTNMT